MRRLAEKTESMTTKLSAWETAETIEKVPAVQGAKSSAVVHSNYDYPTFCILEIIYFLSIWFNLDATDTGINELDHTQIPNKF